MEKLYLQIYNAIPDPFKIGICFGISYYLTKWVSKLIALGFKRFLESEFLRFKNDLKNEIIEEIKKLK